VTKDVGLVKDAMIYDQSVPKILVDAIIKKSDTVQIIFSAANIEHKGASPQLLLVYISLIITAKTGKWLHILRMRHLIIPFDRGRKN
jgi:hypothetical protein